MTDADKLKLQEWLTYVQTLITTDVANKGLFKTYTDIPAAPSLSTPVTIIPSDEHVPSSSFLNTLHGMSSHVGKDIILDGNFIDSIYLNDYTPTSAPPYYNFVNAIGAIYGSNAGGYNRHGVSGVTDADHQRFYGLNALNPAIVRSTLQNGFQLSSRAGGAHYILQNIVIDTPGASGTTFNFGGGGSNFYEDILLNGVRVFNAGQEGICYIGNTSSGFHYINTATVHDCFTYNSQREGTQWEHINLLLAYKNTVINSGQSGAGGQDGLIQLHDLGPGSLVRDSIYDGAPNMGTAFTHGTTVRNCYFRWTTAAPLFIGDATTSYFAGSSRLSGQPQLYDGCIFHCDNVGTLAQMANVAEVGCNIEFRNCIFSNNITALYLDTRAGSPSNSLIGTISTNGNSKAAITAPTYGAGYNVYSNYLTHGLCNSTTYRNLHMGFRQIG